MYVVINLIVRAIYITWGSKIFELSFLKHLEGNEMNVHGMMDRRIKHGVHEVPIFSCADCWVLAGSAFAKLVMPVYEELESFIS